MVNIPLLQSGDEKYNPGPNPGIPTNRNVAQLEERFRDMEQAVGSSPIISTNLNA